MTQEQEEHLRYISKFLRAIFAEDISACATILTAEAEILEGRDIKKNVEILTNALTLVSSFCEDLITIIRDLKGE